MNSTLQEAITLVEEQADPDAGASKFQQALGEGLSPGDQATAHLHLGRARLMQERLAEASSELRQALEIDPSLGEAHTFLGLAAEAAGDLQTAVAEKRQGVELSPDSFVARYNLATTLADTGDLEEAVHHFERAAVISNIAPMPHYQLGRILLETGETDRAVDELALSLALRPDFIQPALLLAEMAAHQGNLEGAERILLETLEHAPQSAELLEALVQVATAANDTTEARGYAERWRAADPDDPRAELALSGFRS